MTQLDRALLHLQSQVAQIRLGNETPLHGLRPCAQFQPGHAELRGKTVGPQTPALDTVSELSAGELPGRFLDGQLASQDRESIQQNLGRGPLSGSRFQTDPGQPPGIQNADRILQLDVPDVRPAPEQRREIHLYLEPVGFQQISAHRKLPEDDASLEKMELQIARLQFQTGFVQDQGIQFGDEPAVEEGLACGPESGAGDRGSRDQHVGERTEPSAAPGPLDQARGMTEGHEFFSPQLGQTVAMRGRGR